MFVILSVHNYFTEQQLILIIRVYSPGEQVGPEPKIFVQWSNARDYCEPS